MPVYVRKNAAMSPPMGSDIVDQTRDDDFLLDQDQFRDNLPQPYRMIHKVLLNLVDSAWEVISDRQKVRIREESKIRAPQYECTIKLQEHGDAHSICRSNDGELIFFGLQDGLAAVNAKSQETLDIWQDDSLQIVDIRSAQLGSNNHVITTLDDMGACRIFAFASTTLFLLQSVQCQGDNSKMLAAKCELSKGGDYIGMFFESPDNKSGFLEIHKCPKDTWLKELEAVLEKSVMSQNKTEDTATNPEESVGIDEVEEPAVQSHRRRTSVTRSKDGRKVSFSVEKEAGSRKSSIKPMLTRIDTSKSPRTMERKKSVSKSDQLSSTSKETRPKSRENAKMSSSEKVPKKYLKPPASRQGKRKSATPRSSKDDRMQHKFTSTTVTAKLLPPSPPQGTSWSSPMQIAKTIDTGDVIGAGSNHQVSQQHLDLRWDTFCHFHQQHLQYINKEEPNVSQPTFHFLTPGTLMPQGLDNPLITGSGQPTAIGVWWSGHHQFRHYSLLKQTKAETEMKPDLVWPYSAPIVASCVSPCTSLLAVALKNNIVIVWNKYLGFCQRMSNLKFEAAEDAVTQLEFLDPAICPQPDKDHPLDSQVAVYLMVTSKEGQIFLLTCSNGDGSPPRDVSAEIEKEDEKYTMIQCMEGIPELILTVRVNGRIYIHNILTGHVICEVTLPEEYQLGSPWQPVTATALSGQMTFIGGKKNNSRTNPSETDDSSQTGSSAAVFVFDLSQFPLSVYQKMNRPVLPYVTHFTVNQRVDTIMRDRISQQPARKERMERRWQELKMELRSMKQASTKVKGPPNSVLSTAGIGKSILNISPRPSQVVAGV